MAARPPPRRSHYRRFGSAAQKIRLYYGPVTHRLAGSTAAAFCVAVILAALASAIYHAFGVSDFVPIRLEVVTAEQTAERHLVTIPLPDLSSLRGQPAVLSFELRNGGPERKRIGLLRDGLPAYRIELPPNRDTDWTIVLPPALVEALYRQAGDVARTLELTADADVWSLMAFEIRNYHVHWGDRVSVAVLPANGSRFPRVVLSAPAFFLLATALLTPMALSLLRRPRKVALTPSSLFAHAARGWKTHEVTLERGAGLLGLVAIAIAQPIFEVVSNTPEFFPARNTPPATIVATLVVICFVLPLALLAVERTIRIVSPRAASAFTAAIVAALIAAVVMPWFRRGGAVRFPWDVVISAAVGVAFAIAYARTRGIRQFLTALAPAAVVVPALFLMSPTVRQHFQPSESGAAVQTVQHAPPIVLVIFDELPTNSLLSGDGAIDAGRFPNFGALARGAYWFRNSSTVAISTSDAVPAILSGRYVASEKAIPTLRHWPVNLFTALAPHYRIFASIRFQRLCPPSACQQNAAIAKDSVSLLVSDLSLVWLHIVLPENLTERLPPVVGEWAEFGRAPAVPRPGIRRGREGWFAEFLAPIDRQPAQMHVLHLVLPHMPFEYVPSGRRYSAPDFQSTTVDGSYLFDKASAALADTIHQRHLAQVGYADRLVGDLLARLHETGAYDPALVIITADHGASHREGQRRRNPRPSQQNLSDILQVPLFIKLPGQRQGEVVDRIVETVDIFPTILDVVGAKPSIRLDGRSLIDGRDPGRRSFFLRNRTNTRPRRLGDLAADRAASLGRKERRFGRGDLQGLYAPPDARHLLGTEPSRAALKPAGDVRVVIDNHSQYESVALERDPLPIYVSGVLETSRRDPLNVVVVVNGTVAAIAQSYHARGGHMFGTLIPETMLRDGKNTVTAFVPDTWAVNEK